MGHTAMFVVTILTILGISALLVHHYFFEEKSLPIVWLGHPVFVLKCEGTDPELFAPFYTTREDVSIGLRSDGVVVWRKIAKEE